MGRLSVEPGEIYGQLTVVRRLNNDRRGRPVYECCCHCGKVVPVSASHLRSGNTKSCGCLKLTTGVRNAREHWMKPPGHAARNVVYKSYIRDAARFHRVFELDFETFCHLTQQNCHYCGAPPSTVTTNNQRVNGQWIYNGLDRVDSDVGCVTNNVVPCCEICNRAKLNLSSKEFLDRIGRIARHLSARNWQVSPPLLQ